MLSNYGNTIFKYQDVMVRVQDCKVDACKEYLKKHYQSYFNRKCYSKEHKVYGELIISNATTLKVYPVSICFLRHSTKEDWIIGSDLYPYPVETLYPQSDRDIRDFLDQFEFEEDK